MTREEFKKQIEYPLNHFITNEDVHFWERNHIKATIGRTLRLALQYPNLAQEYLESLPKATMDKKVYSMTKEDYLRLSVHIAMLEDIAEEYPGKTIENIIAQLEARRNELNKSK